MEVAPITGAGGAAGPLVPAGRPLWVNEAACALGEVRASTIAMTKQALRIGVAPWLTRAPDGPVAQAVTLGRKDVGRLRPEVRSVNGPSNRAWRAAPGRAPTTPATACAAGGSAQMGVSPT